MGKEQRVRAQADTLRTPDAFSDYARWCLAHPWAGRACIGVTGVWNLAGDIMHGAWSGARRGLADGVWRIAVDFQWFRDELRKLETVNNGKS